MTQEAIKARQVLLGRESHPCDDCVHLVNIDLRIEYCNIFGVFKKKCKSWKYND